ncbi:MAG: hypothetical protein KBS79_00835 [Lachnospiraceae bacterium]|nr:hypothetical protein [Candidatus Minthocola equi]
MKHIKTLAIVTIALVMLCLGATSALAKDCGPEICKQPENVSVNYPLGTSFTVVPKNLLGVVSYQWYFVNEDGYTIKLLGVTAKLPTLIFAATAPALDDGYVYCVLKDILGNETKTEPAYINIKNADKRGLCIGDCEILKCIKEALEKHDCTFKWPDCCEEPTCPEEEPKCPAEEPKCPAVDPAKIAKTVETTVDVVKTVKTVKTVKAVKATVDIAKTTFDLANTAGSTVGLVKTSKMIPGPAKTLATAIGVANTTANIAKTAVDVVRIVDDFDDDCPLEYLCPFAKKCACDPKCPVKPILPVKPVCPVCPVWPVCPVDPVEPTDPTEPTTGGGEEAPKMGDDTNILLWTAMFGISAAGITMLTVAMNRSKKEN